MFQPRGSGLWRRANFYASGGEVTGPKVHGKLHPVGGDWLVVRADGVAILDVRTTPEYTQVGHVPGTPLVEWPRNGDAQALSAFVEKVRERYTPDEPLLLLCRSGARSHYAAHLLARAGYARAYNVLEGFEGGAPGLGWVNAGLPWERG